MLVESASRHDPTTAADWRSASTSPVGSEHNSVNTVHKGDNMPLSSQTCTTTHALCTPELCCASNESVRASLHHGTVGSLRSCAHAQMALSLGALRVHICSFKLAETSLHLQQQLARYQQCAWHVLFTPSAYTLPPLWWRYSCAMQAFATTSLHSQCACASAACCSTSIMRS